jgi:hypothetical protein
MRTLLTSYPFIIFLAAIIALLYPSCEPADPIVEELPATTTIILDFSDPNTHAGNTGGYSYLYDGVHEVLRSKSYSATYLAWETWSCEEGPDFFAAWDDTSNTVWIAHCTNQLLLESITVQSGDGGPLSIASYVPVAGANESTCQLTLDPANSLDTENGITTITLSLTYN